MTILTLLRSLRSYAHREFPDMKNLHLAALGLNFVAGVTPALAANDGSAGSTLHFGVEPYERNAILLPIYHKISEQISTAAGCPVELQITTLNQVAGHIFVYSDPASTSGHLLPSYALQSAGIDPKTGLIARSTAAWSPMMSATRLRSTIISRPPSACAAWSRSVSHALASARRLSNNAQKTFKRWAGDFGTANAQGPAPQKFFTPLFFKKAATYLMLSFQPVFQPQIPLDMQFQGMRLHSGPVGAADRARQLADIQRFMRADQHRRHRIRNAYFRHRP
jgi:hypothetical protein